MVIVEEAGIEVALNGDFGGDPNRRLSLGYE